MLVSAPPGFLSFSQDEFGSGEQTGKMLLKGIRITNNQVLIYKF